MDPSSVEIGLADAPEGVEFPDKEEDTKESEDGSQLEEALERLVRREDVQKHEHQHQNDYYDVRHVPEVLQVKGSKSDYLQDHIDHKNAQKPNLNAIEIDHLPFCHDIISIENKVENYEDGVEKNHSDL